MHIFFFSLPSSTMSLIASSSFENLGPGIAARNFKFIISSPLTRLLASFYCSRFWPSTLTYFSNIFITSWMPALPAFESLFHSSISCFSVIF